VGYALQNNPAILLCETDTCPIEGVLFVPSNILNIKDKITLEIDFKYRPVLYISKQVILDDKNILNP